MKFIRLILFSTMREIGKAFHPNRDNMSRKIIFLVSTFAIALASCANSAPQTPALTVGDIQNTAQAGVWTLAAQTKAAIPTITPLPTETPSPIPSPTIPPTPVVQPTMQENTPTTDICNMPIQSSAQGQTSKVLFVNASNGTAMVSFGLIAPTPFNECGVYNFQLQPNESQLMYVLRGTYYASAYIYGKKGKQTYAAGRYYFSIMDPGHKSTIKITADAIMWQ